MKFIGYVLLMICVTGANALYARGVKPEISKVTVYYDSAFIQREGTVPLVKGENVITIDGLPAALVNESVQVYAKGAALKNVRVHSTYLAKGDAQRIEAVREKLNAVKDEITAKQNEIASINSVLEYIKKGSVSPFSIKMTAGEMQAILQLVEQHSIQSYGKISKLQQAVNRLNKEKDRLEKELSLLNTSEMTKSVQFTLLHTDSDTASLVVQYLTQNAGWNLSYEARADSEKGIVDVASNALVFQNTGEDWNNVSIELSTAKPFVATRLPQLDTWYIDIYRPSFYKEMEAAKSMNRAEDAVAESPQGAEDMPAMEEGRIAFSFSIKGKKTIPSDGNSYALPVAKAAVDCVLRYTTIPKVLPYVLLEGEFKNPFDFPMQGGSMHVYLDNKYVNTFTLEEVYVPKDPVKIALGVDESISVERMMASKKTEYKGLVSRTRQIEYVYVIKLGNGKKRPVTIAVQDAVPVSQNEKITVTLVNRSTIGAVIDKDGKAAWEVQLGPNQKKDLTIHFTVEFPDNIKITGLD